MADEKIISVILDCLKGKRFSLQDEKILQAEIHSTLKEALKPVGCFINKEHVLDDANTIDFMINNSIGIEVKIKGSKRALYSQCERYCKFDHVKSMILITNLALGFPRQLNGKNVYVLKLGTAWL